MKIFGSERNYHVIRGLLDSASTKSSSKKSNPVSLRNVKDGKLERVLTNGSMPVNAVEPDVRIDTALIELGELKT